MQYLPLLDHHVAFQHLICANFVMKMIRGWFSYGSGHLTDKVSNLITELLSRNSMSKRDLIPSFISAYTY